MQNQKKIKKKIIHFGRSIKFSHSIFALPFALSAVVLALKSCEFSFFKIFWIIIAMVGARCAAMGFNRLVDADIDAKNPRTKNREIPAKILSKQDILIFILISSFAFVLSSFFLNRLCFYLSFIFLILLFSYSYLKRFSYLCHLYLGFVIALSPVGAWIAICGHLDPKILILSFALMMHIASFDIIYAILDIDFDKSENYFSIPAKFGADKALLISAFFHILSFLSFILIYFVFDMGKIYLLSQIIIGILFFIEHKIVKKDKAKTIDIAFFHVNSIISVVLFLGVLGDFLLR